MKRIIIIGYMGAGKTTVGYALSKLTGWIFYDLDWYIENRMRKSVSELFENVIISCGGGTPCFYNNIDYMNEQGETIYLKASPEVLFKHIKMTRVPRPLLKDKSPEEVKEFIKEQIAYREPFYLKAKHVFDINLLDTREEIIASASRLKEMIGLQD